MGCEQCWRYFGPDEVTCPYCKERWLRISFPKEEPKEKPKEKPKLKIKKMRRNTPLMIARDKEILRSYESGQSAREIAEKFGMTRIYILYLIRTMKE